MTFNFHHPLPSFYFFCVSKIYSCHAKDEFDKLGIQMKRRERDNHEKGISCKSTEEKNRKQNFVFFYLANKIMLNSWIVLSEPVVKFSKEKKWINWNLQYAHLLEANDEKRNNIIIKLNWWQNHSSKMWHDYWLCDRRKIESLLHAVQFSVCCVEWTQESHSKHKYFVVEHQNIFV